MSRKKNGYMLLPTADPDRESQKLLEPATTERQNELDDYKPGLFVKFSKDRHRKDYNSGSEEKIEMTELRRKKPKSKKLKSPKSPISKRPRYQIIEEPLLPGDTIQRISLRYSCPVAEIRRLNKLYNDGDIHGLTSIKIPVREYSVLTDEKEREKRRNLIVEDITKSMSSGNNSGEDIHFGGPESYYNSDLSQDADDEDDDDSETTEYRDISIQSALKWKYSGQTLLQKLDEDLEKAKQLNETYDQSNVQEIHLTFESPSIHPVTVQDYTKSLLAVPDWRILLAAGIGFILLVGVGMVVLCVNNHCPITV